MPRRISIFCLFMFSITVLGALLLCGCGRTYGVQACRMKSEIVLTKTRSTPVSVAVKKLKNKGFAAAWASDNATWITNLNSKGEMIETPRRIRRQSTASTVVLPDDGQKKTFWPEEDRASLTAEHLTIIELENGEQLLLILERPSQSSSGGVFAVSFTSSKDQNPEVIRIGSAFEYAGRITAKAHNGDIIVAWHEGRLDVSNVVLARVGQNPLSLKNTSVLGGDNPAFYPSLEVVDGTFLLAWSEIVRENRIQQSLVKVAKIKPNLDIEDRVIVNKGELLESSPELAVASNHTGLVFRDDLDGDGTPEYYFSLLGESGKPKDTPRRISQADGWNGPSLAYMESRFVATAIRSFQRNLLIGLNQFNLKGEKLGGEFQVYADKSDFVRVDVAAQDGEIIMIYAEDRRDSGRVLSARVNCL